METPICSVHGTPMTLRPAGISKSTGKAYEAFWACAEKNPDGSFCRAKPTMPNAQIPTVRQNTVEDDIREINFKLQVIADAIKNGQPTNQPTE